MEDLKSDSIPNDNDLVNTVVLFKGGGHLVQKNKYKNAIFLINEFRKFCLFKFMEKDERIEFSEKYGSPYLCAFDIHPIVNEVKYEKFKEPINFCFDMTDVSGIYWYIPEEKTDLINVQDLEVRKELLKIMKEIVRNEKRGDEWMDKGEES